MDASEELALEQQALEREEEIKAGLRKPLWCSHCGKPIKADYYRCRQHAITVKGHVFNIFCIACTQDPETETKYRLAPHCKEIHIIKDGSVVHGLNLHDCEWNKLTFYSGFH